MKRILIYDDYGCSNTGNLKNCLEESLPDFLVETVDATQVIKGELDDNVHAFIMPGGAATPYKKKLEVLGNEQIRNFVKNGGTYLGICAGAYYACKTSNFELDVPELSSSNHHGLDLFNGSANGTLYKEFNIAPYSQNSESKKIVSLNWQEDHTTLYSLYHGGPYFEANKDEQHSVLATYGDIDNNLPAIIEKNYGRGKVILSAVHFEDKGEDLIKIINKFSKESDIEQAQLLYKKERQRSFLAQHIMNRIKGKSF